MKQVLLGISIAVIGLQLFGARAFAAPTNAMPHDWKLGEGTLNTSIGEACTFQAKYPVLISTVADYNDPRYPSDTASEPVRAQLNKILYSAVQASLNDYMSNQQSEGECSAKDNVMVALGYDIGYMVQYAGSSLLSVTLSDYSFTGGAHGLGVTSGINLDVVSGKQLGLQDMLTSAALPVVLDRIAASLTTQGFDLTFGYNAWRQSVKSLADVSNYTVAADGLAIDFNPYDVGPYAMGAPEVKIAWSALSPYVVKNGPAAVFLAK